jgi:tetratricopeptide (TPR) repeat protein
LESEHDNLRRAITFCLEEEARAELVEGEKGLRLGWALQRFWGTRGYLGEGRERLAALLSLPLAQARTRARAGALLGAGNLAESQGDFTSARSLFAESLAIRRELGDRSGIAASLNSLGNLASTRGEQGSARSLYEESLAIRRESGTRTALPPVSTIWGI